MQSLAPSEPAIIESLSSALSPLSTWRKVLAVFGGLLGLAATLWLKVASSLLDAAWGVAALALGLAALGMAYAGVEGASEDAREPR